LVVACVVAIFTSVNVQIAENVSFRILVKIRKFTASCSVVVLNFLVRFFFIGISWSSVKIRIAIRAPRIISTSPRAAASRTTLFRISRLAPSGRLLRSFG
jgi:hypothetical protein